MRKVSRGLPLFVSAASGMFFLLAALAPGVAQASPPRIGGSSAPSSATAACLVAPTTLCLNNLRFKVEVQWKDFQGNTGAGKAVSLTGDTGYFWFFSSSNVELVVKVVDGRAFNASFWVFYGALSNVEYTMTVTDSVTGSVKSYVNPSGRFGSVGDTQAFSAAGTARSAQRASLEEVEAAAASNALALRESLLPAGSSAPQAPTGEQRSAAATGTCAATETSLCLNGGRFRVEVAWTDFAGKTGVGTAVGLTGDTGYFWFFSSNNVELAVKVLDARGLNSRFWVFYGALSNVEYSMKVTDTLTGNVNTYSNPSGRFASVGDTEGFRTGYSVAAQLDSSRAVSRLLPPEGGTLSATAADGTVFTLTVPDGALLSEEEITMTPVAAIDRLPLSGGLAAAVQLAPEGLRLFQPATLVISPPAAIPVDEETTFAWRGTGEEFFLYPPEPLAAPAISLALFHFSGYGVGRGSSADQAAQRGRPPESSADQLEQDLQGPAAEQRKTLRTGGTLAKKVTALLRPSAKTPAQVEATRYLTDYFLHVLEPNIPLACSDNWKGFLGELKRFKHRVNTLTGPDATLVAAYRAYFVNLFALIEKCYDEAYDRCKSAKDPSEGATMSQIYGALKSEGASIDVDLGKISKCLTFELSFDSLIEELQPSGPAVAFRHHLTATVPATAFATDPTSARGHYEVSYIGVSVTPCDTLTLAVGAPFRIAKLSIDVNVVEAGGPAPRPLAMEYDPGNPDLTFSLLCPGFPDLTFPFPGRWRDAYKGLHTQDVSPGGFIASDWTLSGSGVYARKTYKNSTSLVTETTKMELRHNPQ